MTSPLPQVLVAGVAIYIQYKKLWICGSVEYVTACLFPSVDKNWRGVQFVPHTEFSSGPRSQTSSPFPQILELKSQNRDFNSLLCEIFTYLAVKLEKSGIQRVFVWLCRFCAKQNGSTYHIISIYCHIYILYDKLSIRYEQKDMVNSPHEEIGGAYEDCRRANITCQT